MQLFRLIFLGLITLSMPLWANKQVQGVRVWGSSQSTRVVFDLSEKVNYRLFILENPYRVVVDIEKAVLKTKLEEISLKNSEILKIRHSIQNKDTLRMVLDLQNQVKSTSFLLSPNGAYGHRLVVDLSKALPKVEAPKAQVSKMDVKGISSRPFVVAIDPGHGGKDSGAISRHQKLREKDIVFSVAKKLQSMINMQHGMRAFLIRTGDYYVGLRKRMEIARDQGADLFISVHADSFKDPKASGASVFVLSEKGASNEAARWLAESENRADLIGGVSLEDKGNILASVLLDLSQTACKTASHELGGHLLHHLSKVTDLHHQTVQHAGFMVLKSPDIPSVLVELGFISNPIGEKKLATASHQYALASALLSGVKAYAAKRPMWIKPAQNWQVASAKMKARNGRK